MKLLFKNQGRVFLKNFQSGRHLRLFLSFRDGFFEICLFCCFWANLPLFFRAIEDQLPVERDGECAGEGWNSGAPISDCIESSSVVFFFVNLCFFEFYLVSILSSDNFQKREFLFQIRIFFFVNFSKTRLRVVAMPK